MLVDGAQAVAHLPVRVGLLDADFYTFSGRETTVQGPGIGALYAKPELLSRGSAAVAARRTGNMISNVTFEQDQL